MTKSLKFVARAKRLLIILAIFIPLGLLFISQAQAATSTSTTQSFTPQQQQEIQTYIHDYIINHPEILIEASQILQQKQFAAMQQQAQTAITKNAAALLNSATTPAIGNVSSPVTIIEFLDYQCGHCRHMEPVVSQLMKDNPKLRYVFKELPIFGASSEIAARAALAAGMQGKFLAMHEALLTESNAITENEVMALAKSINLDTAKFKTDMASQAITDEINKNLALAPVIGIQGTPAFIVVKTDGAKNSTMIKKALLIPGEVSETDFQNIIQQLNGSQTVTH